jgi:hypothetical protein
LTDAGPGPSLSSLGLNLAELVSNLVYDGGEYRVNALRMSAWGVLTFSFRPPARPGSRRSSTLPR